MISTLSVDSLTVKSSNNVEDTIDGFMLPKKRANIFSNRQKVLQAATGDVYGSTNITTLSADGTLALFPSGPLATATLKVYQRNETTNGSQWSEVQDLGTNLHHKMIMKDKRIFIRTASSGTSQTYTEYRWSEGSSSYSATNTTFSIDVPDATRGIYLNGFSFDGTWAIFTEVGYKADSAHYVYTYKWDGSTYNLVQTISADNAGTDESEAIDFFGTNDQTAISFDASYMVVGCSLQNNGGTNRGALYVYTRSGDTFGNGTKLTAASPALANADVFGISVAMSPNGKYLAAGRLNNGGTDTGLVHVWQRDGSTWTELQTIAPASLATGSRFGANNHAISMNNNIMVINDSKSQIVAGASYLGSTRVYKLIDGTWQAHQIIPHIDENDSNEFGVYLSLNGDVTLAACAIGEADGAGDEQGTHIFHTCEDIGTSTQLDSTTGTTVTIGEAVSTLIKTGVTATYTVTLPTLRVEGRTLNIFIGDATDVSFTPDVTGFTDATTVATNSNVKIVMCDNTWYNIT